MKTLLLFTVKIIGIFAVKLGTFGGTYMCAGLFHEVDIPEILKNKEL